MNRYEVQRDIHEPKASEMSRGISHAECDKGFIYTKHAAINVYVHAQIQAHSL